MKQIASAFFIIIAFLLQSSIFSRFTIGGIIPNLMVVVVASIGFLVGRKYGMITGFISGIILDVFFGSVIGLYALILMYVGYINGKFKKILYSGDFKLPLGLIIVSDIAYGHLCYLFLFLLKGDLGYLYYLKAVIMPETIYTTVIACLFYPLIHFVFNKISKYEERVEGTIG